MGKQRRHERVQTEGQLKGKAGPAAGTIDNISAGGLFIRTANPLPVGMPVIVDLVRPGTQDVLKVGGRVVASVTVAEAARGTRSPGVAIELDALAPATERALHDLLRELGLRDVAEPTAIDASSLHATASPDTGQVAANVRGLLEMLGEALHTVKERDAEIVKLKAEVQRLTAAARTSRR